MKRKSKKKKAVKEKVVYREKKSWWDTDPSPMWFWRPVLQIEIMLLAFMIIFDILFVWIFAPESWWDTIGNLF